MDYQLKLTGEFKAADTETLFREATSDMTRRLSIAVSLVILCSSIFFAINDYLAGTLADAWAPRGMLTMTALCCALLAWGASSWRWIYGSVYLLATGVLTSVVMLNQTRPPDYLLHVATDVMLAMGIYLVVPGFLAQVVAGGLFFLGLLWIHVTIKNPVYELANVTIPMSIVIANLVGLTTSLLYNRIKREFFATAEQERTLRESLETARQELYAVKGLLPMCANCKNIRNDEGYWKQVETFIEDSGQMITHGICPDCAEKLYAEEFGAHANDDRSGL